MQIRPAVPDDTPALLDVWRSAVRATHDFLSADDFTQIEAQVANDYLPHAPLWVACGVQGATLGFLGLTGAEVDTLFIHDTARGQGVGRALLAHARQVARGPLSVDVNEQNPQAVGFYERMGFVQVGRSPRDGLGRPYPLLHMRQVD